MRFIAVAVVAGSLGLAGPATAATPQEGGLTTPAGVVTWQGALGTALTPAPEACLLLACDQFTLDVALPPDVWSTPGGIQIGIRWPDENQDLDLHVYRPDGSLAASSVGFPSSSESVLLPGAANGRYRVVVVPSQTTDIAYEGLAEVERDAPVRRLMPACA